jgi:two-component system response regulator RegA
VPATTCANPPTPTTCWPRCCPEHADLDSLVPENPMSVDRLQWEHIQRVLTEHEGNISATARALGMHRRTLQRKLQKRPVRR